MIEIRQAKDDLPHDVLLGPCGHTRGLLCRRQAHKFTRLPFTRPFRSCATLTHQTAQKIGHARIALGGVQVQILAMRIASSLSMEFTTVHVLE